MVWMVPQERSDKPGDVPTDEMPTGMFKKMGDRYRFRVVSDRNQLKEKIFIFDADLDDRIIELAKLVAASQIPKDQQGGARIFFAGISGEGEQAMMEFAVLRGEKQAGLSVSKDKMYNMLSLKFASALARKSDKTWLSVDRAYAEALLSDIDQPANIKPPGTSAGEPSSPQRPSRRWWPFGRS